MSAFDRLDRMGSRHIDTLNAESVELHPMTGRPNGRAAVDPDRPVISGKGIYDVRSGPTAVQFGSSRTAGSKANGLRTLTQGQVIELSIDRTIYFPDPDFMPRQGDHVLARGRRFVATSIRPDGAARVVLILEELAE